MAKKGSYDFYLILATTVVLAAISLICVGAMFQFKAAAIHTLPPEAKVAWQEGMNKLIAPFLIALLVLLGICVPKRLLPLRWLHRFTVLLLLAAGICGWQYGVKIGLLVILCAALGLQLVVLALALAGSERLHFTKKGYWARVGSSLVHLGLVLFVLDIFFYRLPALHLLLFWVTTAATTSGMICCFYAEGIVRLVGGKTEVNEG
ncbi:MAG: hypothetical protein HGA96_11675 [Desulfobulbaceae bacterium]|nr:hypothetical protein [Desulfobulbaceae bacterium]